MESRDLIKFFSQLLDLVDRDLDVRGLSADRATGLVHHDTAVFQGRTLTFGACAHQYLSHRGCHPDTDGGYIRGDILHGIINPQAGVYAAPGAIDIHLNIPVPIRTVQEQQLGGDDIGHLIVDRVSQENNTIHHQPAVNVHHSHIHGAFLDNVRGDIGDNVFVVV